MYDLIIVGSGPAGCVLAARLSEDPNIRVLLIEAGGSDRHPYFSIPAGFAKLTGQRGNWGWSTTPQVHVDGERYWYPQGKVLGGGSSINAMVYMRGNPWDYDNWATEHGCAGWSYEDVLPYFRRAEDNELLADRFHGTGGPLAVSQPVNPLPLSKTFVRAAQEAGMPYNPDFNGARQQGVGFYQTTTRAARRWSAATAYLRPARGRANLTILTDAFVTRLGLTAGRVDSVHVVEGRSRHERKIDVSGEVIVTAGAIGTPRLLLLSGIGDPSHLSEVGIPLKHALLGVGQNLHDHFDLYIVSELTGDFSYDKHGRVDRTLAAGLEHYLTGKGPAASNLCEAGGFWFTDPASVAPDIQFHFMLGAGVNDGVTKLANCGITLNTAHMRPRSRGTIRLPSADPRDMPLIDPNFWADPYDKEMSIAGFRLGREIMTQESFRPFVKQEVLPGANRQTDEEIVQGCIRWSKTDYHPVGSCRMGYDEGAVVAPDTLKVHGLGNLRICDSSIMPQIVSSNTNAPTIMMAEKASDIILGRPAPTSAVVRDNTSLWPMAGVR